MSKKLRAQREKAAQVKAREQAYCADARNVLEDVVWKYAPRNGNPLPLSECGGRHKEPCCGCLYCCR